jgi:cyclopropane fatty-acyl-phospholipid synthase-like methyltransferase
MNFPKATKYPDLHTIYAQCSGPGGLKLTEFLAEKLDLQPNMVVLDVGFNRGYQTCFLAKEYSVFAVGIDPWKDRKDDRPHIEHLMDNARSWSVANRVLGVQVGLPDTKFASGSFDAIYTTTTLEMIRGMQGETVYRQCIAELYRLLVPGGMLALGEPMHHDIPIPHDLAAVLPDGDASWTSSFSTIDKTRDAVQSQGFKIVEADHAPDACAWWQEFARYDPFCIANPHEDAHAIQVDAGRWLTFGYVIAQKPTHK